VGRACGVEEADVEYAKINSALRSSKGEYGREGDGKRTYQLA
jgi:hypothetical protein